MKNMDEQPVLVSSLTIPSPGKVSGLEQLSSGFRGKEARLQGTARLLSDSPQPPTEFTFSLPRRTLRRFFC